MPFHSSDAKSESFGLSSLSVFGQGKFAISEANLDLELPLINQLVADEGVDLIDMHAALADKPELSADTVHPNTSGATVMAQTAAAALTGKAANTP